MKVAEGGDKLARKLRRMLAEKHPVSTCESHPLRGAEVIRAKGAENAEVMRKSGILAGDIQKEVEKQTRARVANSYWPR